MNYLPAVFNNRDGSRFYSAEPRIWSVASTIIGQVSSYDPITYGNGYFVVCGHNGNVAYTRNPYGTWTSSTIRGGGIELLLDSIDYGEGYFVTLGHQNGGANSYIAYTKDPSAGWTVVASPIPLYYPYSYVAYGDGKWMITGTDRRTAVAEDPSGVWTASTNLMPGQTMLAQYGNGYWVTGMAVIYYATDPLGPWSTATVTDPPTEYHALTFGNGMWVAGGSYSGAGRVVIVDDPSDTWAGYDMPFHVSKLGFENGVFLAGDEIGRPALLYTSIDPAAGWTLRNMSHLANIHQGGPIYGAAGYSYGTYNGEGIFVSVNFAGGSSYKLLASKW